METRKDEIVTVKLTRGELWEVMSLVSAGFIPGEPGNEIASSASKKLSDAYRRVGKK